SSSWPFPHAGSRPKDQGHFVFRSHAGPSWTRTHAVRVALSSQLAPCRSTLTGALADTRRVARSESVRLEGVFQVGADRSERARGHIVRYVAVARREGKEGSMSPTGR